MDLFAACFAALFTDLPDILLPENPAFYRPDLAGWRRAWITPAENYVQHGEKAERSVKPVFASRRSAEAVEQLSLQLPVEDNPGLRGKSQNSAGFEAPIGLGALAPTPASGVKA